MMENSQLTESSETTAFTFSYLEPSIITGGGNYYKSVNGDGGRR